MELYARYVGVPRRSTTGLMSVQSELFDEYGESAGFIKFLVLSDEYFPPCARIKNIIAMKEQLVHGRMRGEHLEEEKGR
jgi:hypothetical protein